MFSTAVIALVDLQIYGTTIRSYKGKYLEIRPFLLKSLNEDVLVGHATNAVIQRG